MKLTWDVCFSSSPLALSNSAKPIIAVSGLSWPRPKVWPAVWKLLDQRAAEVMESIGAKKAA